MVFMESFKDVLRKFEGCFRERGRVIRGWLWNFCSYFYVFCPNDLKNLYCGRFGCFFTVPKLQGSTPIF